MHHRSTRNFSLLLAIICLLSLAVPTLAAGDIGATAGVNGSAAAEAGTEVTPITGQGQVAANAYLYQQASTGSKKIVMLSKNIVVTYTGELGEFYQVTYTNASGKTYAGFIEKSKITAVDENLQNSGSSKSAVATGKSTASTNVADALKAAKAKNSDVIGYISINGTNIQQPILYRKGDVHYYSTRDINQNKDSAGSVYSFYNALYRNNTSTAHNMRGSNRLFHQLHHMQEKALGYTQCQHSKCPARDLTDVPDIRQAANRTWDISYLGYNKWEVFAMYEVKKDEPKSTLNNNIYPLANETQTKQWIETQLSRSEIGFGVKVTTSDRFLTIYTCGTEYDSSTAQSRLYYFLKAVS